MKKILRFLARPVIWSALGLALLLLSLWVTCGLLGLAEKAWIFELVVGIPFTLLYLAYWIRDFLFERKFARALAEQAREQAGTTLGEGTRALALPTEAFQHTIAELNDAIRKHGLKGDAAAMPWILVMGPSGAGKTTALVRSGLRLSSQRSQNIYQMTKDCSLWLAGQAVFLDTAGRYVVQDEDQQEWIALLRHLQRQRRRPLNSVVLQVGIDELLDLSSAEVERSAVLLREQLDKLTHEFKVQLHVHLLVNKVDLLYGFNEFFAELPEEERDRAWGLSLDMAVQQEFLPHSLGSLFNENFLEIVAALISRQTGRLLLQQTREGREAALEFPAQIAALQAPLRRFIEALIDARPGHERPRIDAVYFVSAMQTGERRPGIGQRLATEMRLNAPLQSLGPPPLEHSWFLRGAFLQIVGRAENAARHNVSWRWGGPLERVTVGLSMLACLCVCYFLGGRYRADQAWLQQLHMAVSEMRQDAFRSEVARKAEDSSIVRELLAQQKVLNLLQQKPQNILGKPYSVASEVLLQRIDTTWLVPLKAQLRQDLDTTTSAQFDKPGTEFDRGFQLLKAAHILDGQSCENVPPEETQQSIGEFVLSQWRRAIGNDRHIFDVQEEPNLEQPQSPAGQLLRSLHFLFDREPQDYAKLNSLHLDARLREQARDNLRSADAQEAVLFMVRASNANLYTKVPQLRSSYLSEPGIERVFTRPGCERFFDRRTVNGKHWWKCVLGVEEPKDPINLEEEYRRNYLHAWGNWLRDLSLKPSQKEDKADALTKVGDTLDGLLREPHAELMQVVKLVGIGREEVLVPKSLRPVRQSGCAGWLRKQAVQLNKNVLDLALPKACSQAHVPFELFAQLTARPVDGKDLEEESGLHTIDLFRKYMTAAEVLRTTLYKIRNTTINNRGSQSLKLVADTMGGTGELWALDESRRRLIDNLDGRMRMGATGINVRDSGLHQILLQIERDVWMALLPIAAKTIDERWKVEVFEPWSQLKAKHKAYEVQDSDRVLDIVDFGQRVKEFHRQVLSPLYQSGDSSRCVLQEMAIPFKDALPLLTGACAMLQKFIRVTEITDSQKTLGATGSALKRRPSNADVVPPASCPGLLARAVRLDDGEQLYSCSMASSLCQHEPSGSKRPSLSVSWGANWSFTQHLLGDDYNLFLKKFGRIEGNRLTFVLPTQNVPGQCPGIRVIFVLQPVPGSGAPSKPDNDWKSVDLPTSLIR